MPSLPPRRPGAGRPAARGGDNWEDARAELSKLAPFHVVGQRASDFLALSHLAPIASVFACEGGPDAVALAERLAATLLSPELAGGPRLRWSNRDLDVLAGLALEPLHGSAVLYASSRAWEEAAYGRARLLAVPTDVFEAVDDKIAMRTAFAELGVPCLPWAVCDREAALRGVWPSQLGWPLVVQASRGSSGHHTVILRDLREARPALASLPGDRWLVTRYVEGHVLNVHAVVSSPDVSVGPASVQLSGVPGLSSAPAEYAGNDFGAASALTGIQAEIRRQVHRIAWWLRDSGVRGAVGVDFIWGEGQVWPLEVNPRLQGSTALLGALERSVGAFPTVGRHVLELAGVGRAAPPAQHGALRGAQIVLRKGTGEARPGEPRAGIYALRTDASLRFSRPGHSLTRCRADEVLVQSLPPVVPAAVEAGAVIARVSTWGAVAGAGAGALTAYGRRLVLAARRLVSPPGEDAPGA